VKFELAVELVARFHSLDAAQHAKQEFIARHREKVLPSDLPLKTIEVGPEGIRLANLLKECGLAASTSESYRKIEEGAVRIDGLKISDRALTLPAGAEHIVQVGSRRFARVRLSPKP
jgi:tyrosyl-tRNA synthetase